MNGINIEERLMINARLREEGFEPSYWEVKEVPVEHDIIIMQNVGQTVEFVVLVNGDSVAAGYYTMREDGSGDTHSAQSIKQAIERGESA